MPDLLGFARAPGGLATLLGARRGRPSPHATVPLAALRCISWVYGFGLAGVVWPSVVWLMSAESDFFGAGWPGVPSLRMEYFFGDGDLLGPGGVVGGVCVGLSTVGLPCSGVELESAIIPIAGVGAPVTAALALDRKSVV